MTTLLLIPLLIAAAAATQRATSDSHAACLATNAPRDSFVIIAQTAAGARLVALGGTTGALLHSYPLAPVRRMESPNTYPSGWPAGSIALDEQTCEVIAAAVDSVSGVTHVYALSLRDWQLRTVATIADIRGFPWVDVGASTGRIYLMGRVGINAVVIDRTTGAILHAAHPRRKYPPEGYVWRARVSPDERRVYMSYHGGMDWMDLASDTLCTKVPRWEVVHVGCPNDVHGDFDFFRGNIVSASGGPEILIIDPNGATRDTVMLASVGHNLGHFMWPSVDRRRGIVYGGSYCSLMYVGVLSRAIGDSTAPLRQFADTACGQHFAPTADGKSLVALDMEYESLTVIDLKSGKTTLTIPKERSGGHPMDVVGVQVEH